MTRRRFPVVATLVVLVAVGIMIRLGYWQLDRLAQKEALLARYAAAGPSVPEVRWPGSATDVDDRLFHRSSVDCLEVTGSRIVSGRSLSGEAGLVHRFSCVLAGGGMADVVLGWSRNPAPRVWRGGAVSGIIAPGPRLIADPPLAGLEANARPDPRDIPNNHLSYAVQWFLFAAVALVIYVLAVRKRLLER